MKKTYVDTVFLVDQCLINVGRFHSGAQKCAARGLHRPTHQRRGSLSPASKRTAGQRYGRRCDPHLVSTERESGYTEFPARGYIPPEGPQWPNGADGRSRMGQPYAAHGGKPSPRGHPFASSHRQRASHAIAPTGQGTLIKASLVRCTGRQDQWVSVAMSGAQA